MNKLMKIVTITSLVALLTGCQPAEESAELAEPAETLEADGQAAPAEMDASNTALEDEAAADQSDRLVAVLAAQPEDMQARYDQRHPRETLEFFGIEPGMTVVEALPGGGWYSRILLPFLGSEGRLIGANYPITLFEQFDFATPEFLDSIANWPETFPREAADWCQDDCAAVSGFWLGQLPDEMTGTADAVLFIRALHNMARYQNAGVDDYFDQAMANAYAVLKPGGVLGVVQHQGDEAMPDAWAAGQTGYLKQSFVIAAAEAAGFELEADSDINANPADQPTESDVVWRLPPALGTSEAGSEARASMEAIGESNRMTLRFRKPEQV